MDEGFVIWVVLLAIGAEAGPGHGAHPGTGNGHAHDSRAHPGPLPMHGGHGHGVAAVGNVANFRTVQDRIVPTLERSQVIERGHAHVPEIERGVIKNVERIDSHTHSTEAVAVPRTWTQEIPRPRLVTDHEPQHGHRYPAAPEPVQPIEPTVIQPVPACREPIDIENGYFNVIRENKRECYGEVVCDPCFSLVGEKDGYYFNWNTGFWTGLDRARCVVSSPHAEVRPSADGKRNICSCTCKYTPKDPSHEVSLHNQCVLKRCMAVNNNRCEFPFVHKGVTYNGCTRVDPFGHPSFGAERRCYVSSPYHTAFEICDHDSCWCKDRAEYESECDPHQGLVARYERDRMGCVIGTYCEPTNDPLQKNAPRRVVVDVELIQHHATEVQIRERTHPVTEFRESTQPYSILHDRIVPTARVVDVVREGHAHERQITDTQVATVASTAVGVHGAVHGGEAVYGYGNGGGSGLAVHTGHAAAGHAGHGGHGTGKAGHGAGHVETDHGHGGHGHAHRRLSTVLGSAFNNGGFNDYNQWSQDYSGGRRQPLPRDHLGRRIPPAPVQAQPAPMVSRAATYGWNMDGSRNIQNAFTSAVKAYDPFNGQFQTAMDRGGPAGIYNSVGLGGQLGGDPSRAKPQVDKYGRVIGYEQPQAPQPVDTRPAYLQKRQEIYGGSRAMPRGGDGLGVVHRPPIRAPASAAPGDVPRSPHNTPRPPTGIQNAPVDPLTGHAHAGPRGASAGDGLVNTPSGHFHVAVRDCLHPNRMLSFQEVDSENCPAMQWLPPCDHPEVLAGAFCDGELTCGSQPRNCAYGSGHALETKSIFQALVVRPPVLVCSNNRQVMSAAQAQKFSLTDIVGFEFNEEYKYTIWCEGNPRHIKKCKNEISFDGLGRYIVNIQAVNEQGQISTCAVTLRVVPELLPICVEPEKQYAVTLSSNRHDFTVWDMTAMELPVMADPNWMSPDKMLDFEYTRSPNHNYYAASCEPMAGTNHVGQPQDCTGSFEYPVGLTAVTVREFNADCRDGTPICMFVVEVHETGPEAARVKATEAGALFAPASHCPTRPEKMNLGRGQGEIFGISKVFSADSYKFVQRQSLQCVGQSGDLAGREVDCDRGAFPAGQYSVKYTMGWPMFGGPNGMFWEQCEMQLSVVGARCSLSHHQHIGVAHHHRRLGQVHAHENAISLGANQYKDHGESWEVPCGVVDGHKQAFACYAGEVVQVGKCGMSSMSSSPDEIEEDAYGGEAYYEAEAEEPSNGEAAMEEDSTVLVIGDEQANWDQPLTVLIAFKIGKDYAETKGAAVWENSVASALFDGDAARVKQLDMKGGESDTAIVFLLDTQGQPDGALDSLMDTAFKQSLEGSLASELGEAAEVLEIGLLEAKPPSGEESNPITEQGIRNIDGQKMQSHVHRAELPPHDYEMGWKEPIPVMITYSMDTSYANKRASKWQETLAAAIFGTDTMIDGTKNTHRVMVQDVVDMDGDTGIVFLVDARGDAEKIRKRVNKPGFKDALDESIAAGGDGPADGVSRGDNPVKVTSVQVLQHNTLLDTNSSFNDATSIERAMAGVPTIVKPTQGEAEAVEGDAEEPQAAAEAEEGAASPSPRTVVGTLSVLAVAALF